jgi:hypothetical protein
MRITFPTLSTLPQALIVASLASGCAAAPEKPPATPEKAVAQAAKPDPKPAQAETQAATASEPSEADPRADGLRKPSRPPAELITGPNLVYMFNFKESAVGQAARERCAEGAQDTPREMAACMEKARGKVAVESVRFIKESSGALWWVTYNRYKGNLLKWHKVQYQPGEETNDSIKLNLIGKDKGIAPMARVPRTLSIALPNDYTIVVNDPEQGPMQYDAKIGMLEDE